MLLATENAPPGKRAWYGMFPQLGAPIGFIFSGGVFLLLSRFLTDEQFFAWGWRVPFLVQRDAGADRPLRAADDHRDADLRGSDEEGRRKRVEGAGVRGVPRSSGDAAARHA